MLPQLTEYINNILRPKRLRNIVDSSYLIHYLRKFAGASVFTIRSNSGGTITTVFSYLGFTFFIFWYSLYFYCSYQVFVNDQTILRSLYDTRLKHYGDEVERLITAIFVLYAIWKVPFDLSGSTDDMQQIVDIDIALKNLGEELEYSKHLHKVFVVFLAQMVIGGTRIISIWISLLNMAMKVPVEKVYQTVFIDSIIFIITAQYCTYLVILRRRYKILNNVLNSFKPSQTFMLPFNQPTVIKKPLLVQEKIISKKFKDCGKIYSMLYRATKIVNEKFGLALLMTVTVALLHIVLYLYYFMEATASGLFHRFENYFDFLIFIFWQIGFAISIIFLCIYYSEETVKEAQRTSHVTHEIINSDVSATIITEAVNLSLQTLHQSPTFTVRGLFKLDYLMLLDGARSVTTYLVILLQFVTDKKS